MNALVPSLAGAALVLSLGLFGLVEAQSAPDMSAPEMPASDMPGPETIEGRGQPILLARMTVTAMALP